MSVPNSARGNRGARGRSPSPADSVSREACPKVIGKPQNLARRIEDCVNAARISVDISDFSEALSNYEEAINLINVLVRTMKNRDTIDQWNVVRKELIEELDACKRDMGEWDSVKNGVPPAHAKHSEPEARFEDDPEVWSPPPARGVGGGPVPGRRKAQRQPALRGAENYGGYIMPGGLPSWAQRAAANAPMKRGSGKRTPPVVEKSPEPRDPCDGRRNYCKPWMAKNAKDKKPSPGGGREGRRNFLEHCYPDTNGEGPDSDLISMIEREVVEGSVSVTWDKVAGLFEAKRLLEETIVWPIERPDLFRGPLLVPPKGVLLFGPPGTGKTLLAKAVATQCKTTFFSVSASTLASKYRGDSEKLVRILFEMARFYAPTTIFFDEIDAICSSRGSDSEHESSRRVKAELLVQMDGVASLNEVVVKEHGETADLGQMIPARTVTVLAATNIPWDLDEALRRRLEKRIYIPLPDEEGRAQMLNVFLSPPTKLSEDVKLDALISATRDYSGADLYSVCREAAMRSVREKMRMQKAEGDINGLVDTSICHNDLIAALKQVQRSVGGEDLMKFEKWMKEFGSI